MKMVQTFYHNILIFLVSVSIHFGGGVDDVLVDKDLVTRIPVQKKANFEKCCKDNKLLTCESVTVDPNMLGQADLTILGIRFTFSNLIEPNSFIYKTREGDEALIIYIEVDGNLIGSLKTADGKFYVIESCNGGHVLKEYDDVSFGEDEGKE